MTSAIRFVSTVLCFSSLATSAWAFDLITTDEAGRADSDYEQLRASPFPAPEIRVHGLREQMVSPIDLVIEIRPYGGAAINRNSLQLVYQKRPSENLFPRVRHLVEVQGETVVIRLRDAEVPSGRHQIVVVAEDTRGRMAEKPLTFRVCPKAGC